VTTSLQAEGLAMKGSVSAGTEKFSANLKFRNLPFGGGLFRFFALF